MRPAAKGCRKLLEAQTDKEKGSALQTRHEQKAWTPCCLARSDPFQTPEHKRLQDDKCSLF
jgi:hypothetical protein